MLTSAAQVRFRPIADVQAWFVAYLELSRCTGIRVASALQLTQTLRELQTPPNRAKMVMKRLHIVIAAGGVLAAYAQAATYQCVGTKARHGERYVRVEPGRIGVITMIGQPWHDVCKDRFERVGDQAVECETKSDGSIVSTYHSPHSFEQTTFDVANLRLFQRGWDAMLGRYQTWSRRYGCRRLSVDEEAKLQTEWVSS